MSLKIKLQIWILFVTFLLCFYFVEVFARNNYFLTEKTEQLYILPSKTLAPMLSLGFNNMWADIITLQSQIFVHNHKKAAFYKDGKRLKEMIELVLALDPYNIEAVQFGALALMDDWGNVGAVDANEILLNSFRYNPDEHSVPMSIAFNYYTNSDNWPEMVRWFNVTIEDKDAPQNLVWMVDAILNAESNSYNEQAIIVCTMCEQIKEKEQKIAMCKKCGLYQILIQLEPIRLQYEMDHKQKLADIADLVRSGYLKVIPVDPLGGKWIITDDGRINSSKNPKKPYVR